ncbi:M48 family metallopeptidase [Aestuariibius sp. 2305UL40-4]|uniref:M48 family metallopeptidase n=1 Tax=Aestuariibius violaceus TaxID=3234132 RepID=UPI00345E622C
MCQICFSRRRFLSLGAMAAAMPLAACDERPDLISDEMIEQMGLESWKQIASTVPRSGRSDLQEALDQVAVRLLRKANETPSDWEFVVFASPEANAFALPGGKIGVYEGMFKVTENADQLAAIVGHEIGHVQADHGKERVEAEVVAGTGMRIVTALLDAADIQYAEEIAAALGLGAEVGLLLPYSRKQELEADRLGLTAMARAGFNPREAVELWRNMQRRGGRAPEVLSTHPAPRSRIREIEAMLPELT